MGGTTRIVVREAGTYRLRVTADGGCFSDSDPITITGDTLAIEALQQMERNRRKAIAVLPVVAEDTRMLGLLRLHDLVQAGLASG